MLKGWLRAIKIVVVVVGVLLGFFAVVELVRAHETLSGLHPWAGYTFAFVVLSGLVWLVYYVIAGYLSRPAALRQVVIEDSRQASARELIRYGKYLMRYIDRLSRNDSLSQQEREQARTGKRELTSAIRGERDTEKLRAAIFSAESGTIQPLLERLDEAAEKQIRICVRDVMGAVAFCPYRSADLLIVLYRNVVMLVRIMRIYNSRGRPGEQLAILGKTLNVVATVNYIGMGKDLLRGLGAKLPGAGRLLDDIVQGTGAGFMTSVVGHAAQYCCRSFKGWDEEEAREDLRQRVKDFYKDVKDLFKKDILPAMMNRVAQASKETWEKISTSLDETHNMVGEFVRGTFRRRTKSP